MFVINAPHRQPTGPLLNIVGEWRLAASIGPAVTAKEAGIVLSRQGRAHFDDQGNFIITTMRTMLVPKDAPANVREQHTFACFGVYALDPGGGGILFRVEGASVLGWKKTVQHRVAMLTDKDVLTLIGKRSGSPGSVESHWTRLACLVAV